GCQRLVDRIVGLDQHHEAAAALQIGAHNSGIGAGEAGARVRLDKRRAIRRDRLSAGYQRLPRDKAELLDRPPKAADPVLLHLQNGDALDVVTVALDAFEMRVEREIVDVVFAVSGGEANDSLARPDGT